MKTSPLFPLCSLVLTLFAFLTPAQAQCDYARMPARFEEIVSAVREHVTNGELPSVAIAVAQQGSIVCQQAWGWANREKQVPATPNTVYAAGSVAKALTGAATYMLAGQGAIRLDDTLEQYGVHVRSYAGTGITIRQLLTMTAGVQHGWFYHYDSDLVTPKPLDRYAISAFPPGQNFIYSNFSYGILGEVVERAGKRPFSEFLRDALLNRLQMTSSTFDLTGRDVAVGYRAGTAVPPYIFDPGAGGGFYTSAHDLALFGLLQIDSAQRLIAPDLMKEMHSLETEQQRKSRYTGGWGIVNFKDGSSVLLSNGRVLAGSATLLVLPKEGIVITCLTNTSSDLMDDLAFRFADLFSPGLLAKLDSTRKEVEAAESPRPFHGDASQHGSWVGTISTPKGDLPVTMKIANDDHIRIGIRHETMVQVQGVVIEDGLLTGEVATSIQLPETGSQLSKLKLQLLWLDRNRLAGTARVESTDELSKFGLPLYISLRKQK